MGKVSDYVSEKYVLLTGIGSGVVGVAVGGMAAAATTPAVGLTGILAGAVTFAAVNLFRYRSQEEVNEILGIEPMELTGGPTGAALTTNPRSAKAVTAHVASIMDKIIGAKDALGVEIIDAVVPVFTNLNGILKQWHRLEGMTEVEYTVEAIVYDYLPTSLEAYINVSKHDRKEKDGSLKKELIEQLGILARETEKIRESLYAEDLKPLTTQTNFLKARFGGDSDPQLSLTHRKTAE